MPKVVLTDAEITEALSEALADKQRREAAKKLNKRFQKLMVDAKKAGVYGHSFTSNLSPFA